MWGSHSLSQISGEASKLTKSATKIHDLAQQLLADLHERIGGLRRKLAQEGSHTRSPDPAMRCHGGSH